MPIDEDVEQAAREFRAAIDAAGPHLWRDRGMRFPRGACGHAAELLGRYLIDRFGIVPDYVCQDGGDGCGWHGGHAWLEWEGLTIDITGDQFDWEPVIVTRESQWHGRGVDNARHPVCLEHQRDWWLRECGPYWDAITLHLAR